VNPTSHPLTESRSGQLESCSMDFCSLSKPSQEVNLPVILRWLTLFVGLFFSNWVMALPDDECMNDAVPMTTPSSDFTLLGNGGIVRHETTKLEWQRCTLGRTWDGANCTGSVSTRGWSGALESANLAGPGWRLPNVNELASIAEDCRVEPAINRVIFPDVGTSSTSIYWTSSPVFSNANNAWVVIFHEGSDAATRSKVGMYRVRLVRDSTD